MQLASNEPLSVTKADWEVAIQSRADQIYADLPLTEAQKFSKSIGAAAYRERGALINGGDELCCLYFRALKIAPKEAAEVEKETKSGDIESTIADERLGKSERRISPCHFAALATCAQSSNRRHAATRARTRRHLCARAISKKQGIRRHICATVRAGRAFRFRRDGAERRFFLKIFLGLPPGESVDIQRVLS